MKFQVKNIITVLLVIFALLRLNHVVFAQNNIQLNGNIVDNTTQPVDTSLTSYKNLLVNDSLNVDSINYALKTTTDTLKTDTVIVENELTLADLPIAESTDVENEVSYNAQDSIVYDFDNETIYLYGGANLKFDEFDLTSGKITFKYADKIVIAESFTDTIGKQTEKPVLKEGAEEFKGDKMVYNIETKRGKITKLTTQYEQQGYIHGNEVLKSEHDELLAKDAFYTTCSHEEPHFKISVDKVKVIPKQAIVSGPANLQIANIPTPFVLPFAFFPVNEKRNKGIIAPNYGNSNGLGFYLKSGYYLPINEFIDLAIPFEIYLNGSFDIGLTSRYNVNYRYGGSLNLKYGRIASNDRISPEFTSSTQFSIGWTHRQDSKARPNSSFSSNINIRSSEFNRTLNAINNVNGALDNSFNSSLSYSYNFPRLPFSFTVSARHAQNTNTRAFSFTLPDFNLRMQNIYPFERKNAIGKKRWYESINVGYSMSAQNSLATLDTLLFERETYSNFKNGFIHNIPINTSFKFLKHFTLSPSFSFRERWVFNKTEFFFNENGTVDENGNINNIDTVETTGFNRIWDYSASASLNTRLYGFLNFRKGKIKAIRHVVNPSISFSYKPDWGLAKYNYYGNYVTQTTQTIPVDFNNQPILNEDVVSLRNDYSYTTTVFDTIQYDRFANNIYNSPSTGRQGSIGLSIGNQIDMKVRSKNDTIVEDKKVDIFRNLNLSTGYNLAVDSFNMSNIRISANTNLFNKFNITLTGNLNPYFFDTLQNRTVNRFHLLETKNPARFQSFNMSISTSFGSNDLKFTNDLNAYDENEVFEMNNYPERFFNFNNKWSFSFNYRLDVTKLYGNQYTGNDTLRIINTINANFDVNLTPKLKINGSTGFDFANKELTLSRISIARDLHCWQMSFNWVPLGQFRSYNFQINVKAAVLQDLKLTRRRSWVDN